MELRGRGLRHLQKIYEAAGADAALYQTGHGGSSREGNSGDADAVLYVSRRREMLGDRG